MISRGSIWCLWVEFNGCATQVGREPKNTQFELCRYPSYRTALDQTSSVKVCGVQYRQKGIAGDLLLKAYTLMFLE